MLTTSSTSIRDSRDCHWSSLPRHGLARTCSRRAAVATCREPVSLLVDGIGALEPTDTKRSLRNDFEDREFHIIAVAFGSKRVRIEEFVDRERAFTDEAIHELHTPLSVVPSAVQSLPEVSTVNGGIAIRKAAVSGSALSGQAHLR